jgi:hypothetical protein
MRWLCWRPYTHGAKLWHAKDSVAAADSIKPIERGTSRCDFHSEGYEQPWHGKQCEQCKTATPCAADIDADREVVSGDLSLVLIDFGACVGCPTDFDGDREVTSSDLSLCLIDFGECQTGQRNADGIHTGGPQWPPDLFCVRSLQQVHA